MATFQYPDFNVVWQHRNTRVAPKTVNQKRYVDAIDKHTIGEKVAAALKQVRGGQRVTSQDPEGSYQALEMGNGRPVW